MDPMANWEDLVHKTHGPVMPPPEDEDFSQYFSEYKAYDNLFNEALSTLQDLDVPSGYAQVEAPPHVSRPSYHSSSRAGTPFRHQKKPSGTAIFGFIDHNRELSLNGNFAEDEFRLKPPADSIKSISPTQLARQSRSAVSQDQLELNFDQPFEAAKPIHLAEEEDEEDEVEKREDIIVTNSHPKSYKFPAEPAPGLEQYIAADGYLPEEKEKPRAKKYVPIPVQQPGVVPERRSPGRLAPAPHIASSRYAQYEASSPVRADTRAAPANASRDAFMNMNVFLPPPSSGSSSYESPEPHSPQYSSPQQKRFYSPQFFSDDPTGYYSEPAGPGPLSSPARSYHGSPQSSPIRHLKRGAEAGADDTLVDANETILQLTPLKNQAPMTPNKNSRITLEWSPIISPSEKASLDVRKAIQDLSPRRVVKKTSLLPQGELDRYWEGPDEHKEFTCTYKNCGKKFTRRYNVRSHIQTHLCDRPFVCTYCPKSFVRQHDLNRHIKTHLAAKHCRCRCGKEFTRVEGYRKHLAHGRCHDGVKPRSDAVCKPGAHRHGDNILDALTSNRLNEELGLD